VPIFFPAVNGARIWLRFGVFSLQPGEFAKVLLAVFFASYLAAYREALRHTGRRLLWRRLPSARVSGAVRTGWRVSVGGRGRERDVGTARLGVGLIVGLLAVTTG
ncbi:FtsW/RodA/SpoVE family cell cycle protein, partial [Streptomyces sp. DT18]